MIKIGNVYYIGHSVHMKVIRSMLYYNSEVFLGFLDDIMLLSGGCLADIVEYFWIIFLLFVDRFRGVFWSNFLFLIDYIW